MIPQSRTRQPAGQGGVDVLVLAGDRGEDDPMLAGRRESSKVMLEVAGRPMLARVLEALGASASAGAIHLVGPEPGRQGPLEDLAGSLAIPVTCHAPAASPAASVYQVLEALGGEGPVLLVTGDHALLQAAWVDEFLDRALASGADVSVALVPWARITEAFPESRRTRYVFRDGAFCGANLFLFATPRGREMANIWRQVERDRKRPWRVVRLIGPGALLAFLCRRLRLEDAFAALSRRFGIRARAVILEHAEAAIDVDKPADRQLVERILQSRVVRP